MSEKDNPSNDENPDLIHVQSQDGVGGYVDRWTAGGLVLGSLLRYMIDGPKARLESALDNIHPSYMIQTEHYFIVRALKSMRASGKRITLESLRNSFLGEENGGVFVLVVLDQAVELRKSVVFDDAQVDELIAFLGRRRRGQGYVSSLN